MSSLRKDATTSQLLDPGRGARPSPSPADAALPRLSFGNRRSTMKRKLTRTLPKSREATTLSEVDRRVAEFFLRRTVLTGDELSIAVFMWKRILGKPFLESVSELACLMQALHTPLPAGFNEGLLQAVIDACNQKRMTQHDFVAFLEACKGSHLRRISERRLRDQDDAAPEKWSESDDDELFEAFVAVGGIGRAEGSVDVSEVKQLLESFQLSAPSLHHYDSPTSREPKTSPAPQSSALVPPSVIDAVSSQSSFRITYDEFRKIATEATKNDLSGVKTPSQDSLPSAERRAHPTAGWMARTLPAVYNKDVHVSFQTKGNPQNSPSHQTGDDNKPSRQVTPASKAPMTYTELTHPFSTNQHLVRRNPAKAHSDTPAPSHPQQPILDPKALGKQQRKRAQRIRSTASSIMRILSNQRTEGPSLTDVVACSSAADSTSATPRAILDIFPVTPSAGEDLPSVRQRPLSLESSMNF